VVRELDKFPNKPHLYPAMIIKEGDPSKRNVRTRMEDHTKDKENGDLIFRNL
jgi:hypothetical protein